MLRQKVKATEEAPPLDREVAPVEGPEVARAEGPVVDVAWPKFAITSTTTTSSPSPLPPR